MENKHSAKFLRQRKMMLVLPLMVIPFITLAFWALGGGKGTDDNNLPNTTAGLNLQLPNANLKDERNADKLSFYKEADTYEPARRSQGVETLTPRTFFI
jgi:hypothetical protein